MKFKTERPGKRKGVDFGLAQLTENCCQINSCDAAAAIIDQLNPPLQKQVSDERKKCRQQNGQSHSTAVHSSDVHRVCLAGVRFIVDNNKWLQWWLWPTQINKILYDSQNDCAFVEGYTSVDVVLVWNTHKKQVMKC